VIRAQWSVHRKHPEFLRREAFNHDFVSVTAVRMRRDEYSLITEATTYPSDDFPPK
jgi:hypothetical protein